jgi:hypothetical protein
VYGPADPDGRENLAGKPLRPAAKPIQPLPTPLATPGEIEEHEVGKYPEEESEPMGTVTRLEEEENEYPSRRRVQVPSLPNEASQQVSVVIGSTPQLRHAIIVAERAKTDLESKMDDIATLLERAGIGRSQWIAQVGFNRESLSQVDRSFEYQEEIVITILDSSVKAKAIKMDELRAYLPSHCISVRLPGGKVLPKTTPSVPASEVAVQRERRRGLNFENAALGDTGGPLASLAKASDADPCIEISTFDKLSINDSVVGVATNFGFDIKVRKKP